uniref:Uncharacterized protein n=1 Tax=Pyxicephalus adspersus TaxID=30357 RepID=A0AAV3AJ75_PYXAD|nr:TPA: hypothetical protein GDO54_011712 [Pyxicephalus adspersus]
MHCKDWLTVRWQVIVYIYELNWVLTGHVGKIELCRVACANNPVGSSYLSCVYPIPVQDQDRILNMYVQWIYLCVHGRHWKFPGLPVPCHPALKVPAL